MPISKGNFELVVPTTTTGLAHYWRNNDISGTPWSGPIIFAVESGQVDAVSLIQSNYSAAGNGFGNLELVARIGEQLAFFWRPDILSGQWQGPFFFAKGVSGNPALIQGRFGRKGNFELLVPLVGGGLAHYWRDNDAEGLPWNGPIPFGMNIGQIDAVSLIQSNFSTAGNGPGNLEAIIRIGDRLALFWRADTPQASWSEPIFFAEGISGNPALIESRFGVEGNFELVAPCADGGLAYYWRDNDAAGLPWQGPSLFATDISRIESVSLIQSNFSAAGNGQGNLELVAQIGDGLAFFWRIDTPPFTWSEPFFFAEGVSRNPALIQSRAHEVLSVVPHLHRSPEAEVNRGDCQVDVSVAGFDIDQVNVGPLYPEWVPVQSNEPALLEGEVIASHEAYPGPHVSFEDWPTSHYTHDFTFHVRPDLTPDNRFTNLLGLQIYPDGHKERQEAIEVEWETGLGASNDGNPLTSPNIHGDSGGFFSAGHRRRESIWNWPTLGDRVHIEGHWIWDRGHAPAKTEIHPARLVVIQRHLPSMTSRPVDPSGVEPAAPVLATRIDIFASGDGGALMNNRLDVPPFVQRVPMNSRDYSFRIYNALPQPSPQANLGWSIVKHDSDTFPGDPDVIRTTIAVPPGSPHPEQTDYVDVILPWNSRGIPDTAVFARTIYLYWEERLGVPADFRPRVFRVILNDVYIHKSQDDGDGEYRLFVEVAGNWIFVNESPGDHDILNDGLADTGDDETWGIHQTFPVYVSPGGVFRVHAGGWEADGVNDVFGKLVDPNHPCTNELKNWLNDNLFTFGVFSSGSRDDPIGEVNSIFSDANGYGVGAHEDRSSGPLSEDVWSAQNTDPNDSYRLHYRVEELPWPS